MICRLQRKAHDTCFFPKRSRCEFRFSCNLQGDFACTLQHSVPDRIGLLRSAQGPKLTTIINHGLVPRLVQHEQNTEGTHCIVKPQDRSRVFRSSPKINSNQSRICGKGVGLGLFPSDSLQSQSYQFIGIAHIGPYYGLENDCINFRSNRMNCFSKNQKKSKNDCFFGDFWANFGYVSHIPAIRF